MTKTTPLIDDLKKELEEEENNLLAAICDACHWPYIAGNEDALMKHCDECSICGDLQTILRKHRTVAAGEVMTIAAQEIKSKRPDMDKLLEEAGWE